MTDKPKTFDELIEIIKRPLKNMMVSDRIEFDSNWKVTRIVRTLRCKKTGKKYEMVIRCQNED